MVTRTILIGMAGTASKSAGVQIVGVDPVKEKEIFTLYKTIMREQVIILKANQNTILP